MKNLPLNTSRVIFIKIIISLLFPFYVSSQSVTSLTLINADNEQDIGTLVNGQVLNLYSLPTHNLNVRANTNPLKVGSVRFAYDANNNFRTENTAPYAFAGDQNGNYNAWTPTIGSHIIKATAYSGANASGNTGTSLTVNFMVKDTVTTPAGVSGELKKWHRITVTFDGPSVSETSIPNPFLSYRLDVMFTSSTGKSYKVPGYYAADGNAGETGATSGNKWQVHFSPDETGTWTYLVYFRQGTNIAVSDDPNAGTAVSLLNGQTGTFTISPSDKTGKDLRAKGRLKYVGSQYLQFAETGEYFRKAGADAPENFLAYDDFDNTPNYLRYRKSWAPHVQDWNTGDVTWKNGKGKGIIGAINYLSNQGMNTFSFLTMNIKGDDRNVYPYLDSTDFTRIDVSKVDQWEMVFEHADKMGMHLHFKTQETENDQLLDGGDLGTKRKLYYRELIARFSHHLALTWNLGEENSQTTQQRKDMAKYFYDHDPYKHNIDIHTFTGKQDTVYRPLLGTASDLTGVSIQTGTSNVYAETRKWVETSDSAGKKWIVANDEQGPSSTGVAADSEYTGNRGTVADNSETIRKSVLWGNLMAGGAGVEYYFGYNTGETDLTCQDFRSRAKSWRYARHALEFFHALLPFTELKPLNNVSWGLSLGKDSLVYVLYLKTGGSSKITLPPGNYTVKWYNPRKGGSLQNGSVTNIGSGTVSIGNPPSEASYDWTVLINRAGAPANNSTYQAEDYTAQNGITVDTLHKGYTGSGYVDYGGNSTWIEWNNIIDSSGSATLTFYYANGSTGNRQAAITVNGILVGNVTFAPTGSWTNWQTATINVSLNSGSNSVRVTANTSNGGPNLDKMEVSYSSVARPFITVKQEKIYDQDFSVYPNPTSGIVIIVSVVMSYLL